MRALVAAVAMGWQGFQGLSLRESHGLADLVMVAQAQRSIQCMKISESDSRLATYA